jgi:hypothetical protein
MKHLKGTPVWNKETIANQQIMNEHLANFKRECKVKQLMSVNSAMNVILDNPKQVDFSKVQGKEIASFKEGYNENI